MFDFFQMRRDGRLHPLVYTATLTGFALVRLWDAGAARGPERGRLFEAALYRLCDRRGLRMMERSGSRTLCNTPTASGFRHESDCVITSPDAVIHVEAKHLSREVSKNDLIIFNQKGLDFVLTGDCRLRGRPLYRIILSGGALSEEARQFAMLWGIVTVEPGRLPLPALHWLAGSSFVDLIRDAGLAARIWNEVPILVSPLQDRLNRLPNSLKGIEPPLLPGRIAWATQIAEKEANVWWRALDSCDPDWLERIYEQSQLH